MSGLFVFMIMMVMMCSWVVLKVGCGWVKLWVLCVMYCGFIGICCWVCVLWWMCMWILCVVCFGRKWCVFFLWRCLCWIFIRNGWLVGLIIICGCSWKGWCIFVYVFCWFCVMLSMVCVWYLIIFVCLSSNSVCWIFCSLSLIFFGWCLMLFNRFMYMSFFLFDLVYFMLYWIFWL